MLRYQPGMSRYEVDEIVCVKDRGKIYEAKIIKTQQWSNDWHYFVHFQGWNKKWDRWTVENDVSKKTGTMSRMGQDDETFTTTGTAASRAKVCCFILIDSSVKRGRENGDSTPEPAAKVRKDLQEENLVRN
jgi:hypothetical protein